MLQIATAPKTYSEFKEMNVKEMMTLPFGSLTYREEADLLQAISERQVILPEYLLISLAILKKYAFYIEILDLIAGINIRWQEQQGTQDGFKEDWSKLE